MIKETRNRRELAIDDFTETIKKYVTSSKEHLGLLLDVGCGDNKYRDQITNLKFDWIGMDIVQNKGILLKGKMENIPIHDGAFTCVFCAHAFEHTTDPIKTLKEFKRVLTLGGLLYLVTPYPTKNQIFTMDKTHYFVLLPDQIIRLLREVNFTILKQQVIKDCEGFDNIIISAINN